MALHEKLTWVCRNRARSPAERLAGQLFAELAAHINIGEMTLLQQVAEGLAGAVDAAFRRHCRLAGISGATLWINVDQPALVFAVRQRWQSVLLEVLRLTMAGPAVRRIVFQYGKSGIGVPHNARMPERPLHTTVRRNERGR